MVAKGDRVGGGMDWEAGVSRCRLLFMEWINNEVLPYSTENHVQYPTRKQLYSNKDEKKYPMINHNGKEY